MSEDNIKSKKHYKLLFLLILFVISCIIWVPAIIFKLHFETVFFIFLIVLIIATIVIFAQWRLKKILSSEEENK